MQPPKMVFAQLMTWIHPQTFSRIVTRHRGDYKVQSFSCWDHFLCLAFAQLTYRESLRDIEVCLRSRSAQLYHLGIRGAVSRSTLAHANEHRPWQMYADLAQHLIARARRLYVNEDLGLELDQTVYALDATTVDLCLSVFPWARFRSAKAAFKINTQIDLRRAIPTAIHVKASRLAGILLGQNLVTLTKSEDGLGPLVEVTSGEEWEDVFARENLWLAEPESGEPEYYLSITALGQITEATGKLGELGPFTLD